MYHFGCLLLTATNLLAENSRGRVFCVYINLYLCIILGAPKKHWINDQIMPNVSF